MIIKDIYPGRGVDVIKFGITRDFLKTELGEPDEIDKYSYSNSDIDLTETWHYDGLELSVSFDEENEWRLSSIAVSAPEYTLKGKKLIGMTQNELMKELHNLNLGHLELEDWSSEESPDHKVISSEAFGINFWMEDGELSEIQWNPIYDEEDEPVWPD